MRVGIYCRLSEEDRDKANPGSDSESIQNQKSMLARHAVQQGWDIVELYCDEDYAGSDRDRPAFNRLLADAEAGRLDIVLCKAQSRFSRELEIVEKYIHGLFLDWNVRFVGLVDNADTAVKGNKKSRQINGLVNEWYLEDLSDNIRAVLDDKRAKGQFIGAFAPYGYRKAEADHNRLVIDEPAAAIVRRVFALYLQGWGQGHIARALNDEGIPCPTEYKRRQGLKAPSRAVPGQAPRWTAGAIARMLRNPAYTGVMAQGKQRKASYKSKRRSSVPSKRWIVVPGTHEAIIDAPTWQAAQRLLGQNCKPAATGALGPLSGRVRCAGCGGALHSYSVRGRRYLRCRLHALSGERCAGASIPVALLEARVLQELNRLCTDLWDETLLLEGVRPADPPAQQGRALGAQRRQAAKHLEELEQAGYELYLDKARGVVSEESFLVLNAKMAAQTDAAKRRLQRIEASLAELEQEARPVANRTELVRQYRSFDALTRELAVQFIERVEVGHRDPDTGCIPVSIRWNF